MTTERYLPYPHADLISTQGRSLSEMSTTELLSRKIRLKSQLEHLDPNGADASNVIFLIGLTEEAIRAEFAKSDEQIALEDALMSLPLEDA